MPRQNLIYSIEEKKELSPVAPPVLVNRHYAVRPPVQCDKAIVPDARLSLTVWE